MLNNIYLMGRLTTEPKLNEGEHVRSCKFGLAVDRPKYMGKETTTDFFNCIAWNGTAEILTDWYSKGDLIMIVGTVHNDRYEQDGEERVYQEIVVREVYFTGSRKHEEFLTITPEEIERAFAGEDVPF